MESEFEIEIPEWLKKGLKRVVANPLNEDLIKLYSTTKLFHHATWKRIFEAPYFEPKSTQWLDERKKVIPASEVASALGVNPYETSIEDYIAKKASNRSTFANYAMQHGNLMEPLNIAITCHELRDVGFGLGLLQHPTVKFLAMTPDIILLHNQTNAELKCPYSRIILEADDLKDFVALQREIMYQGTQCSYRLITNLSPQVMGLLDKCITYWHQIQLQMEVLGFEADYAYYCQLGIEPAPAYQNMVPLMTMSLVKRDSQWLDKNIDTLRKVWDEIEFQKILHPKKKGKTFPF